MICLRGYSKWFLGIAEVMVSRSLEFKTLDAAGTWFQCYVHIEVFVAPLKKIRKEAAQP